MSIPLNDHDSGNGEAQTAHHRTLLGWDKAVHFIWGGSDRIFHADGGRAWAEQMSAPFDEIPEAGHFLQDSHGAQVAELILSRVG